MNNIEIHFCCYEDRDFPKGSFCTAQKWQELGGYPLKAYSINAVIKKTFPLCFSSKVVLHSTCDNPEEEAHNVKLDKSDIIIFCYYEIGAKWMQQFLRELKKNLDAPLIIACNQARMVSLKTFPDYCDILLNGDPEHTIIEVLSKYLLNEKIEGKGIIMEGSEVTISDPVDLSTLPSPYINTGFEDTFLPENSYISYAENGRVVCYETQRGCPYGCSFCAVCMTQNITRKKFSQIKEDFLYFKSMNVKTIMLLDPEFPLSISFAKKVLRLFSSIFNSDVVLNIQVTSELLTEDLVRLLSTISCEVGIGLQSSDSDILKKNNRAWNKNLFEKNINLLKKYNVSFYIDLIPGLPGDSPSILEKSFNYAYNLKPDYVGLHVLFILENTYFYNKELNNNTWFIHKKWGTLRELESNDNFDKETLFDVKKNAMVNETFFLTETYRKYRDIIINSGKSAWKILNDFRQYLENTGHEIDIYNTSQIQPNVDIEEEWENFFKNLNLKC